MSIKKEEYNKIKSELIKELNISNVMAAPKFDKIVVNVGAGSAKDDNSLLEQLVDDITKITGQKAVITRSKKAISNFKLREDQPIGVKVTLRGDKMWDFFDKLVTVVLPRVKDFRGVSYKSFDGNGNYSMGLADQTVFPEIDTTKVMKYHPLQIVITTSAKNDDEGYLLLKKLGMPFRAKPAKK